MILADAFNSDREIMGATTQNLKKYNEQERRAAAGNHEQGILEHFNRTLPERLFGAQYAQEILMAVHCSSERSAESEKSLPLVILALNNESTRLLGMKPKHTIKAEMVTHKPSRPARRAIGLEEVIVSSGAIISSGHFTDGPDQRFVCNFTGCVKLIPRLGIS